MKTLTFKTNINCGGCVDKVTPILDNIKEIESWSVNTQDPNKILTIESDQLTTSELKNALEKVGFNAVEI